ncbi:MAG: glycosyl transferase [Lachnospiraceae bacterium]|nr:glycosyl transferase [Lachnospiraceae bacterium]
MKYGYFDDPNREYVITTPETPLPWINYLGNDGFYGLISNTAGGYCFYQDAKLRRITRFRYNNVPVDAGGRMYYIKDGDTVWSPAYSPAQTVLDSYECRHGMGYTTFTSSLKNVEAKLTAFVPLGDSCELNRLDIVNNSAETKELTIFSCLEWCLWNAVDDANNYQRNLSIGELEVVGSTIYHKTEYRERRNHYAFFTVNADIAGFDTDRDTFLGFRRSWNNPIAVENGASGDSKASGWYPIASHSIKVKLAPGEKKSYIFQLGYVEVDRDHKWESKGIINKAPAKALIEKYNTEAACDKAFADLRDYWNNLLSIYHLESGNDKLNRMVNIWHQYQCMVTFNMSRSASYWETGTGRGMGFRDSCQDLLGFMHLVPDRARARIIDIASIQFENGSTYHQYQPLTKRGNADIGGGFNDDPLWLVACTCAYIRETGDFTILDHPTPFNNVEGSEKPLLEHLRRSVNFTINNKGPHGLPLIGRADWNDCLNLNCFSYEPGESFQTFGPSEGPVAESVFIAGMFVKYGLEYADLCSHIGLADEAASIRNEVDKIKSAAEEYGWDGEWFVRAYDANGNKVGSNECEEGKIFIEPQGFCTMAGIGKEKGYGRKALDSVKKYLVNDYGVEILAPCYTTYHVELGEISSYPPGYKENGAIFTHNNPWVSVAATVIGDGEMAFDIYRRSCPAFLEDVSEIHRTEPYVYSQMIAGREAPRYGEAKNSFLTGTAAWAFVDISQAILGIAPTLDGLSVNPCLPADLNDYTVTRRYRGCEYHIHVLKDASKKGLFVDGTATQGNLIPVRDAQKVEVEYYL